MSRLPAVLQDSTPLDGPRIDLPARIGWLLRTSRIAHGVDLRAMAAGLSRRGTPISAASVSRLETSGLRDGSLIDGYEQLLGLEDGQLRGVVDVLCRTFDYAPVDRGPEPAPLDLARFSNLVDAVCGASPSGGDWLRFARQHVVPRGFGLPISQMTPLVRRLASELGRSHGTAYVTRYEALALLRCSPYADVVAAVVRERVMAPDAQEVLDLASVVSELPTPSLLTWAGELLNHDSTSLVRAGEVMVQNMRSVGGLDPDDWWALEQPFLSAFERADADPDRRALLTQLFRTLPPALRTSLRPRLAGQLQAAPGPRDWTTTRRNVHHALAARLAAASADTAGLGEEPMLTRLLFEALFDFRGPRISLACMLIRSSPYAAGVSVELLEVALCDSIEATIRESARSRVPMLGVPAEHADPARWLASSDPWQVRTGYLLAARQGHRLRTTS
ncbi:hypothetical protein [Nocardioides sp.]|uniref:hypothetical protein n=1 Tax=Nocardioides sp. TaxID=35761 RepID=UPI0035614B82